MPPDVAEADSACPPPYRAPRWLPGGHLQTVWPYLRGAPPLPLRRERWEREDGDFNDLDWLDGSSTAPLVVLFHGLEGSSRSHYARALMHALRETGWRGVVAHFRGCSGEANRLPRADHAGDSAEIAPCLAHLRPRAGSAPLYAVGVSLGGNALLKWLGESGARATGYVTRAAAVSAPLDMVAAGQTLDRGMNRLYAWHFLRSLKRKMRAKRAAHSSQLGYINLRGISSLRAFDDRITAPMHGFRDALDYWQRSSAKPLLPDIRVPTLILHARNDPFLPASALPTLAEVSPTVLLDYPASGGHAGFLSGPFPGCLDWLPQRLLHFLTTGH